MGKTPQDDTFNEHDKLQYKYFKGTLLVRKTSWYQMYMPSLVFCKIQDTMGSFKKREIVSPKKKKGEKKIQGAKNLQIISCKVLALMRF